MRKSKLLFLSILAIASLALTACTKAGDTNSVSNSNDNAQENVNSNADINANESNQPAEPSPTPSSSPTQTPTPEPSQTETPSPAVKKFNITAKRFEFTPSTITVNRGDTVKINLTATDTGHGISIPEFNFSLKADQGETKTGEFVATKTGTFTFFCNVVCGEGHKDMKGTLIVK